MDKFIAAVVQAAPVVFDPLRTIGKLRQLAGDAARKGARPDVFRLMVNERAQLPVVSMASLAAGPDDPFASAVE